MNVINIILHLCILHFNLPNFQFVKAKINQDFIIKTKQGNYIRPRQHSQGRQVCDDKIERASYKTYILTYDDYYLRQIIRRLQSI